MTDVVFGEFVWNATKAASNLRDHGVSFEEAASVIATDIHAIVREDGNQNGNIVTIGVSAESRIITVVNVDRWERIRIISAWRASKDEIREYRERR